MNRFLLVCFALFAPGSLVSQKPFTNSPADSDNALNACKTSIGETVIEPATPMSSAQHFLTSQLVKSLESNFNSQKTI